jgi:hypothetical protein
MLKKIAPILIALLFQSCRHYYNGGNIDSSGNLILDGSYSESYIQIVSRRDIIKIGLFQNDKLYCGNFHHSNFSGDTLYYQSQVFPLQGYFVEFDEALDSMTPPAMCDSMMYFIFTDSSNKSIHFTKMISGSDYGVKEIKTQKGNLTIFSNAKNQTVLDTLTLGLGHLRATAYLGNSILSDTCMQLISFPNFNYKEDSRCIPLPVEKVKLWKTEDKFYQLELHFNDTVQSFLLQKGR